MRGSALVGPVPRVAAQLATAAIAWGATGAPCAAAWFAQPERPPQTPAAAPRGEDGAVGRRDPFLPARQRAAEPRRAAGRARGLAGLRVGEVKVVGIVTAAHLRLAVLEAPDGRTYVTRVNDRLADGIVGQVARDSVVFLLSRAEGLEGASPGREMRRALGDRSDRPSPRRSPRRPPLPGATGVVGLRIRRRRGSTGAAPSHAGSARNREQLRLSVPRIPGAPWRLAVLPERPARRRVGRHVAWRGACIAGGFAGGFHRRTPRAIGTDGNRRHGLAMTAGGRGWGLPVPAALLATGLAALAAVPLRLAEGAEAREIGAGPAGGVALGQSASRLAKREYAGSPVSMSFQSADLRSVLRTFAEISGLNIVIDPQVEGRVEVALVDVPWDQALDIILRANRLGYELDGSVLRVAPLSTLADEERQRRARAEQRELEGELRVLVRSLSYGRAADLGRLLTRAALSPRGQVEVDERTNTVIVTDLDERLDTVRDLLDTLDRAEPQVEIRARIVQARRSYARELGIRWGVTGRVAPELGNTTPLVFPNRGGVTGRAGGRQGPGADGADERAGATEDAGTAVSLGALAATSALGLALGAVDGSLNLDLVLSAAEHEGHVETLSSPRVTTQNNVQATIVQGDQIPIQTVANNTVTVQFKDAALRLAVTPQITAADTVILQLEIDNDFVNFGESVNGVPPLVTQRAVTTVQVADGDTTVIGGIYQRGRQRRTDGVPGLSRIPWLGRLFRRRARSESTDELMIFLTPRIVRAEHGG